MPDAAVLRALPWFGLVGGAATCAYATLTWLLATRAGLPATFASLASYAVAGAISYFGHRGLTFRSRRPHREAVAPFMAVTICGYFMASAIPGLLSDLFEARIELSIAATCAAVPMMSYFAMNFVFQTSPADDVEGRLVPIEPCAANRSGS